MRSKSSYAAGFVLSLCLLLPACALPPDALELKRHLAASTQMGWTGLVIESVTILNLVEMGKDWKADTSYSFRLTHNKDELPSEEQKRIASQLSMCDSVLIRQGDHCTLRGSVVFARSAYGWMPKELVTGRPDLLSRIAEESKFYNTGAFAQ